MPFIFLQSELRYCNLFWNASTMNEVISPKSPILRQKLVAMATSFEDHKVMYQVIKPFYTPANPEILVQSGRLDSEILGLVSQSLKNNF